VSHLYDNQGGSLNETSFSECNRLNVCGRALHRAGARAGQGRGWIGAGRCRGGVGGLQRHPVRGAAGRRSSLARPSAGSEMGGGEGNRQVRTSMHPGHVLWEPSLPPPATALSNAHWRKPVSQCFPLWPTWSMPEAGIRTPCAVRLQSF
jgi:hypothetical protein